MYLSLVSSPSLLLYSILYCIKIKLTYHPFIKLNVVFQLHSIDYEGPLPEMEEDGDVSVPMISTRITEDEYEDLCLMIDPMARVVIMELTFLHYVSQ